MPGPEPGGGRVGLEDPWNPPPRPGELTGPDAGDDTQVTAGLDRLDQPVGWRRRRGPAAVLAPMAATVGVLAGWQVLVWLRVKPIWVLPGPVEVWRTLFVELGAAQAASAVWTSLSRGLLGFALSLAVGTVIGVVVGQIRPLRLAFRPLLSGMQSLPSVAWVPAAVVWFQLSSATVYAVVLLGAVPSIAMGLIGGVDQTPPLLTRVGRVLGANRWQLIRHVLLPAALPTYLSGIKQGWAFSWRSLMAAEIIVRSPALGVGLGQLLNQGRDLSDMSLVFATILLVLVVGVLVEVAVFAPLERLVLRRRGLAATAR